MHNFFIKLSFILILTTLVFGDDYELKKLLVFSRHNVRTPLHHDYFNYSSKTWPPWSHRVAASTERGYLLEKYMGKYFSLWFQERNFSVGCPEDVNIYANNAERTISGGYAFSEGAFPKCALTVKIKNTTVDPVFNLYSRNLTRQFEEDVQNYMRKKLSTINYRDSLELVQNIVDVKNSPMCKEKGVCDLVSGENKMNIEANKAPVFTGSIRIAARFVDTFLMQYYNGFDMKDVAWGLIKNEMEWKTLLNINWYYLDVVFNDTNIARDISLPLVKLVKESLLYNKIKFNYLVGHDGNIYTMFRLMNFKPYELVDNFEKTPIGGKVVFQKWYDRKTSRYLLKIEYVYASFKQLREMQMLSLENPPKRVTLEMDDCPIDENGFCSWDDFKKKWKKFEFFHSSHSPSSASDFKTNFFGNFSMCLIFILVIFNYFYSHGIICLIANNFLVNCIQV